MGPTDYVKAPCAEFPNGNGGLHCGTGWFDADDDLSELDDIEIVDELRTDDAVDEAVGLEPMVSVRPLPSGMRPSDPFLTFVDCAEQSAAKSGANPECLALLRALLGSLRLEQVAVSEGVAETLLRSGLVIEAPGGLARSPQLMETLQA